MQAAALMFGFASVFAVGATADGGDRAEDRSGPIAVFDGEAVGVAGESQLVPAAPYLGVDCYAVPYRFEPRGEISYATESTVAGTVSHGSTPVSVPFTDVWLSESDVRQIDVGSTYRVRVYDPASVDCGAVTVVTDVDGSRPGPEPSQISSHLWLVVGILAIAGPLVAAIIVPRRRARRSLSSRERTDSRSSA
jgi:hypothetical protein